MLAQITIQLAFTLMLGALGHYLGQNILIATGFGIIASLLIKK